MSVTLALIASGTKQMGFTLSWNFHFSQGHATKKSGFKFAWSNSILGNLRSAAVSLFSSLSRVAMRLSKEGKKASWTIGVNSGVEPD